MGYVLIWLILRGVGMNHPYSTIYQVDTAMNCALPPAVLEELLFDWIQVSVYHASALHAKLAACKQ